MDYLTNLPNELIHHIFLQSSISLTDLKSLMLTSRRFFSLIDTSNELWKHKFIDRWPQLTLVKDEPHTPWKTRVRRKVTLSKSLQTILNSLSLMCYPIGEPPIHLWDDIISRFEHQSSIYYAEYELIKFVYKTNQTEDITLRYFARKALRYFRCYRLEKDWEEYSNLPLPDQSLLKGAVFVSNWGQIESEHWVTLNEVEAEIDSITNKVAQFVHAVHGAGVLTPDPHYRNHWNTDPGNPPSVRKVLASINSVLYDQMGFRGSQNYYQCSNSFIEKVLESKEGIPITLCIVYHEVAKRLGINCDPVGFPQHFLLKWKEFPEREQNGQDGYTYIDAFNRGEFRSRMSCPALVHQHRHLIPRESYHVVRPTQVLERMALNLIQCSRMRNTYGRGDTSGLREELHYYRLAFLINPADLSLACAYGDLCDFLGIELEEAIRHLKSSFQSRYSTHVEHESSAFRTIQKCENRLRYLHEECSHPPSPHRRPQPQAVHYAVGMIMRHAVLSYRCVVIDWDPICTATTEWCQRMGVYELERGVDQPFYHVLVEDGTHRYVAEENLQLAAEVVMIHHPDVGRYFRRFDGRRYVPNAEKEAQYPDDEIFYQSHYTNV